MKESRKKYDYDTSKVKKLIRETNKTYRKIAEETSAPYASVVYHGRKIRGRVYRGYVPEPNQETASDKNQLLATATHLSESISGNSDNTVPIETKNTDNLIETNGTTTMSVGRKNVSLEEAETVINSMIRSAKEMGLSSIDIRINNNQ